MLAVLSLLPTWMFHLEDVKQVPVHAYPLLLSPLHCLHFTVRCARLRTPALPPVLPKAVNGSAGLSRPIPWPGQAGVPVPSPPAAPPPLRCGKCGASLSLERTQTLGM